MSPLGNDLLPPLHPYAFVGVQQAGKYIKRGDLSAEADLELWVRTFINSTTEVVAFKTGRNLAARVYRTPLTRAFTLTAGQYTATTGDTTDLLERDEIAAAGIPPGTLIESVDSATAFTMSKQATANGAVSVTIGFGPLVIDGHTHDRDGYCQVFYVPEFPVQELVSVSYRDYLGALTAVNITGARISDTGRVLLPNGYLPEGSQNIEIECVAGYLPPSAGLVRGFSGWHDGALYQQRMIKICWSDFVKGTGRVSNQQFGEVNEFVNDYRWPMDVVEFFGRHRRMW